MHLVSRDSQWNIYRAKRGYIVHNACFDFKEAHTHVRSFKTANDIVEICRSEKVPRHWPMRLIESVRRVAMPEHADVIECLQEVKTGKEQRFRKVGFYGKR